MGFCGKSLQLTDARCNACAVCACLSDGVIKLILVHTVGTTCASINFFRRLGTVIFKNPVFEGLQAEGFSKVTLHS